MSLCEVRIPTYKRPHLLKRATSSLLSQTYENWQAIVLDDSPEQEGKKVVEYFNDSRVIYIPNKSNFGRAKNLDQAFLTTSYVGGEYACVLEDDNYLFSEFISENIKSLKLNKVNIVFRALKVGIERNNESIVTDRTNLMWYSDKRIYSPFEIRARLFFGTGISNSGLFWNTTGITSNLQVGPEVEHSLIQEKFRALQINEPIYFEPTPLGVFTVFYNRTWEKRTPRQCRMLNRANQSIYMYLIRKYGDSIIQQAKKIATMNEKGELCLEQRLIDALYLHYDFRKIKRLETLKLLVKPFLRYILYEDPFKDRYARDTFAISNT